MFSTLSHLLAWLIIIGVVGFIWIFGVIGVIRKKRKKFDLEEMIRDIWVFFWDLVFKILKILRIL